MNEALKRMMTGLVLLVLLIVGGISLVTAATSDQVEPRLTATASDTPAASDTPTDVPNEPDLVVTWMKFTLDPSVSCFVPGMGLGTEVFFSNIGGAAAGSFMLELDQNGMVYTTVIAGLGAGESSSYWFSESGTSIDPVTAVIDSSGEVAESDETNNSLEQQIPIPTPYVDCTPTGTGETPTPTDDGSLTLTPSVTPSVVPDYTPLENGGFEDDASNDKLPDGWRGRNLERAHRVCDKVDKQVAFRGQCAFLFKPLATGKLSQKVVIPVDQVFTSLTLSAQARVKHDTPAALGSKLKVVYASGDPLTLKLPDSPSGDGYQYLAQSAELTGAVQKVVVSFRLLPGKLAKIWLDDVVVNLD